MIQRNPKMYGPALKSARLRAGLSQEELGNLLNRDSKYISRIENGHQIPDAVTYDDWIELTKAEKFMHHFRFEDSKLQTV